MSDHLRITYASRLGRIRSTYFPLKEKVSIPAGYLKNFSADTRGALDFTPGLEADRSLARRPVVDALRTKAPGRMAGRFVGKVL